MHAPVLASAVAYAYDAHIERVVGPESQLAALKSGQHDLRLQTQLIRERLLKVQSQLQPPAAPHQPSPTPVRSSSSLESTFASSTAHLAGSGIFDDGLGSTPRVAVSRQGPASSPANTNIADPFPHLSNPRPLHELIGNVMPHYIFKLANMRRGMTAMQSTLADTKRDAKEIYASSGLPPR